jgi:hypothetical protein
MSVILETSKGDIVLDLFVDECPKTVQNFLKYDIYKILSSLLRISSKVPDSLCLSLPVLLQQQSIISFHPNII